MKQVASFAGVFNVVDLFPSLKILHFISGTNRKLLQLHRKVGLYRNVLFFLVLTENESKTRNLDYV